MLTDTLSFAHSNPTVAVLPPRAAVAGKGFTALDASRTWIVYWITHGLALLGDPLEGDDARKCVAFLARCQDASGGFGGGPGQLPHLAPTYAAVSALLTLGGDEALGTVDRKALHAFLLRMKVRAAVSGGASGSPWRGVALPSADTPLFL